MSVVEFECRQDAGVRTETELRHHGCSPARCDRASHQPHMGNRCDRKPRCPVLFAWPASGPRRFSDPSIQRPANPKVFMTAKSRAGKTSRKAATSKVAAVKSRAARLPEWIFADLYSGIDAPEVARDLPKMDADCVAFETDYKGKLAEFTARDGGGAWLAGAVRRYEAIDDLAGRLGSYAGLVHAGDSVDPAISKFYGDVSERLTAASTHLFSSRSN